MLARSRTLTWVSSVLTERLCLSRLHGVMEDDYLNIHVYTVEESFNHTSGDPSLE
jgi:hypothetical protein